MKSSTIDSKLFFERLVARKAELIERLEQLEDVLDDPKSADFSDHATEAEFDEVYESQGKEGLKEVAAINAALKRIEDKSFGICMSCGDPISEERLQSVPHAANCRKCMQP